MRSHLFRRLSTVVILVVSIIALSLISGGAFNGQDSRAVSSAGTAKGGGSFDNQRRVGPVRVVPRIDPYRTAFSFSESAGMSLVIPMITAVKSSMLATDVNGNGFVNPGDTLMYSVVVSNAGTDAMNVVFTDTLDANLTLVGSAIASPIAVNDTYASIGNVGITVPAVGGVLVNDVNPQGTGTVMVVAAAGATSQAGAFSIGTDGSFAYLPPLGFEGVDTFTYTLTHSNGKSDTATVTITVSGMIWFINAAAAPGGFGRLNAPFNTLAAFQAVNNGVGSNPAAGDTVFIYAGNYTGPLTLLNNQKVIGAGSGTGTTLAGLAGITLPPFSNALPATDGSRPSLSHSSTLLTLASGNTIRGFNVSNTGGNGITGTNFGNLTANLVSVTSTTGSCTSAVTLTTGNPNASFTAINAANCTNGIVLNGTTGSFTVTGDGTLARNGSGGVINNILDDGVSLTNATNVTLQSMNLTNIGDTNIANSTLATTIAGDHAVQISGGSNVVLSGVYIQNPKGGVLALDLIGTNRINSNSRIEDLTINSGHGIYVANANVSMTLFELNNMQMVDNASTYSNAFFLTRGTGNVAVTVTNNCIFEDLASQAITAAGGEGAPITGTLTTTISNSTFRNGKAGTGENNVGILTNRGIHTATVSNNTFDNIAEEGSIANTSIIRTQNNGGQMTATVSANQIQNIFYSSGGRHVIGHVFEPLAYTASDFSNITFENNNATNITYTATNREFIFVDYRGTASGGNVKVLGNSFNMPTSASTSQMIELRFRQSNASTVNVRVNGNVGTGNTGSGSGFLDIDAEDHATVNATVTNNNFTNSNGTPGPTMVFATETATSTMCANISGNTLSPATITLNETAGTMNITQPSAGNLGAVNGGAAVSSSGSPAFNQGTCALPPLMAPLGGAEGEVTRNGGGNQQTIFERLQGWVRPIFSAFAAPVGRFNVGRLSNWVSPAVSAAGEETRSITSKPVVSEPPQRTMLIDRKTGNYRVVPTAALPSMMAGETITINGGGGGFTLPAGESTTIMFNATIAAGFTGSVMTNQAAVSGSGFATVLSNNLITPVFQPVTISKAFSPTRIAPGGSSTVTLTLANINPVAQTNASFNDTLTNMTAVGGAAGGTCVGASSNVLGVGATNLSFSGITVPPGSSCTVTFAVTSSTTGVHANQTSGVTTAQTTPTAGPPSNSANLTVAAPPTISKAFGAATIPLNGTTTMTLNIANPNASLALSGIAVTDNLPAGLVVATPNGLTGACGGTVTAVAGSGSVSLTGGSLAESGSCMITVNVTGTTAGVKNNTTGAISSTETGAGATSNTASLTVVGPPVISKSFGAATIPLNGSTSLTFTITNNNSVTANGVAMTDNLPAGLVVATPNGLVGNCGGAVTATAGSGTVSLTGGSIASNVDCVFSVNVTGTTSGPKNNTTGNVSSTNGGTGNTANASVTVIAPPTISKAFGAASIPLNGTTTLTLTINNPNAGSSLTGVAVTDSFPAGLEIAATPGLNSTCGGTPTGTAGSTSLSLTGGSIPASGNCTVTVNVTGTTGGVKINTTGNVSSTNGGTGNSATANLTVGVPPTITKAFGASTIPLNGSTTMTLTIANPNASLALTGVAVADSLPAGLVVATPNGLTGVCGGTVTAVAGSGSVSLTGGSLAALGNCIITVNVTGTTAGVKNNTTGNVTSTETGAGGTGSATVTVVAPPSISKAFGAATIPLNGSTSLTFTITNSNSTVGLTGVAVTDNLPAGLVVATPNGLVGNCGGAVTATAGSGTVSLTGGSIAQSGNCVFSVNVTGTTSGVKNNTTGNVSSTNGGTGNTANASVTVLAPPTISKTFGTSNIPLNGTTTLTLTINNPNAGNSLTGVAVTDNFPAGLVISTPNGLNANCGGTPTGTAGSTSLSLTGGTIPASGSCAVTVNVTGTTPGSKVNTTGTVSSTNGGTGLTATATLSVNTPPTIGAVANSRQQGSPASNSTIANVNDADQAEDTLAVTVNGGATATVTGVSVSNIAVSAAGVVTADVVASCTATNAAFTLRVTDDAGVFAEATLNVTVTANTPPILSYGNLNLMAGNGGTNNPLSGPSDNGSVSSIVVQDKGTFTGGISVNAAGVVTVTGAAPVGNHTIKIRATDNCGATTDATFFLAVSGVAGSIADPAVCNGPAGIVDVTATVTNGSISQQPATFTATLPAGLLALPGTCTAGTGSCSVDNASTVTWSGLLSGGQTVTIKYKAQFGDQVLVGTQLCITSSAAVGGSAAASVQACATVNCPAIGPGIPFPTDNGVANDQKPGSVLIYNIYTSSTNPNLENTRINLTNIDPSRNAYVHLYFVEGASCSVADMYLCLTPNQTTSFVTSDFDPGTTGYLVAVAVDRNGCPINFNYLIGDAYVKFASGHSANLSAISVAAKAGGPLACGGDTVEATLKFDGESYDVLPQVLAADNIPSRADGNETMLVLNRIGGSLSIGAARLAPLFGLLYDDSENGISFTLNPGTCQYRTILSNTAPRTVPRFEQFIPAGRSGWMKLWQTGGAFGMTGSMINFNANAAAAGNAFNQGHNLHVLTTTSSMSYTIPVFPAGC
ncbi:MAG: Ig-like domain-containing protein [Blastocatellales bacterium]